MEHRRAHISPDQLPADEIGGRHLRLPDRVAHYVRDVLRMEPGDALELFDGDGRLLECRLQSLRDDVVQVAVLDDRQDDRNESSLELSICTAIPKGNRWRWVLEKATELGVSRIEPLETDRTVVRIADDKVDGKLERWHRIVGDAARQCERTHVPDLVEPLPLDAKLDASFDGLDLALHTRDEGRALVELLDDREVDTRGTPIRVWVGPEGGFTDAEANLFRDSDAHFCHLGPRILRSETAAIAATTLLQATAGDLSTRERGLPHSEE